MELKKIYIKKITNNKHFSVRNINTYHINKLKFKLHKNQTNSNNNKNPKSTIFQFFSGDYVLFEFNKFKKKKFCVE